MVECAGSDHRGCSENARAKTIRRSGLSELRLEEERANLLLGDLEVGVERSTGEPAPVEAGEDAWQREREREQRERNGRS